MDNEQKAIHLEVLSAINGRIRLQLERPVASAAPFRRIPGMRGCRYNARIRTLLCEYDPEVISEEQLIVRLGAAYAAQTDASLLHIKRSEEEGFSMAPSGYLALLCIGLDGALSLAGSPLTTFTRWLSTERRWRRWLSTAIRSCTCAAASTRRSCPSFISSIPSVSPAPCAPVCWRGLSPLAVIWFPALRASSPIWSGAQAKS